MPKRERRAEAIWIETRSRWQIKVQKDGVRKTFISSTPGRKGKHEAEGKADDWLEATTTETRFNSAWSAFLGYHKDHNGTSNYLNHESVGRLYILPNIQETKWVSEITPITWQKCVDAAIKRGLSRRSCINVKLTISAFITFCRRNRWQIERLERGDIVIPQSVQRGAKKIIQPDALRTLFTVDYVTIHGRQVPSFFIHAWRLVVLTGLRRGELCGIRNREDLVGRVLTISRSINAYNEMTGGKNDNARRSIYLSDMALAEIKAQRDMLKEHGIISPWLFPDEFGERLNPTHLSSKWLTYTKQHGINVNIHEMRHTFVSMVKNEMPEPMLKITVGHSDNMDTYGVYGHKTADELASAARIVDSVFTRALAPKKARMGTLVGTWRKKRP